MESIFHPDGLDIVETDRGEESGGASRARLIHSLAEMTAQRDRDELELVLAETAVDLLGAKLGIVWRLVDQSDGLKLRERARLEDGRTLINDARHHQPGAQLDLADDPDLLACFHSGVRHAPSSFAGRHVFPIMSPGGVVGFLDLRQAAALDHDHRRVIEGLLRIYHNHLAILDYGENDDLTGLRNRKTFEAAFTGFTRAGSPRRKSSGPFTRVERRAPVSAEHPNWLAVADVDHFKRVNDAYGHYRGDEVLVSVARLMRASFRQTDSLFRAGGEEFVIVLRSTEERHVENVLGRFRAAVEATRFVQVGAITVSIGYTRIEDGDNGQTAFRRADSALYVAKREGRNRIVRYEEPTGRARTAQEAAVNSSERA